MAANFEWAHFHRMIRAFRGFEGAGNFAPQEGPLIKQLREIALRCWLVHKNPQCNRRKLTAEWAEASRRFSDVHESIAAIHYHLENIKTFETQLDKVLEAHASDGGRIGELSGNYYWGITNKLTFEFQAMTFQMVCACGYAALATGKLFGRTRSPHLKSLKKFLENRAPRDPDCATLVDVLRSHESKLALLFSEPDRKSVRDRIAHEFCLPAGSLHIADNRVLFEGGLRPDFGFSPDPPKQVYRLSELLSAQLRCIEDFMTQFVEQLGLHIVPEP